MTHKEMQECFRIARYHLETLETELHALARLVDGWVQTSAEERQPTEPLDSIGE